MTWPAKSKEEEYALEQRLAREAIALRGARHDALFQPGDLVEIRSRIAFKFSGVAGAGDTFSVGYGIVSSCYTGSGLIDVLVDGTIQVCSVYDCRNLSRRTED